MLLLQLVVKAEHFPDAVCLRDSRVGWLLRRAHFEEGVLLARPMLLLPCGGIVPAETFGEKALRC